VVDTPSNTVLFTGHMKIDHMEFVGYGAATDQVEVQDLNGRLVALLKGNSDLNVVSTWENVGWVRGLKVPTTLTSGGGPNLPSGKLIIYQP
jgi:hypothetical protein